MSLVAGALVALPSTASGNVGCSYATGPSVGPVSVQAGPGGLSKPYDPHGGAALAVGACLDTGGTSYPRGVFYGGAIEYGQNADTTEEYVVVEGDDRNIDPGGGFSGGYVGVSNYEADYDNPKNGKKPDRPPTGDCDGVDDDWTGGNPAQDGPDTNSGGLRVAGPAGAGRGRQARGAGRAELGGMRQHEREDMGQHPARRVHRSVRRSPSTAPGLLVLIVRRRIDI